MGHQDRDELRIDLASFECVQCGHKSTPPEAINAFANEMEIIAKVPVEQDQAKRALQLAARVTKKTAVEQVHPGNVAEVKTEGAEEVTRLARSYAKVTFQDATELTESKHIVLACPNCNAMLYEVQMR